MEGCSRGYSHKQTHGTPESSGREGMSFFVGADETVDNLLVGSYGLLDVTDDYVLLVQLEQIGCQL